MATDTQSRVAELEANMAQVILGKPEVIRMCIVTLLAGEHLLLEDVPGVGKTLVAKALAKSVSGDFCRIQFTPDLLPSDIIGSSLFQAQSGEFVFSRGPVFANIVLADEINRTTPRTQSALLEAMSDRQVSIDGQTHPLPLPFMVIATQNPFEFEGTYPLPGKPARSLSDADFDRLSATRRRAAGALGPSRRRAGRYADGRSSMARKSAACRNRCGKSRSTNRYKSIC